MELLERERALSTAGRALAEAAAGQGRVVLVSGEAGIGKSALCAALRVRHGDVHRFFLGACDPLLTPRALGPFHDIALQAGGALAGALAGAAQREGIVAALLGELSASPPRVLVLEDVHWADEGTLDLLALLGRRMGAGTGALIVTLRPAQAGERLRAILGEIPGGVVHRIELSPLGAGSVAELARRAGRPAQGLHDATGGNPFYVTELLAAAGGETPRSVRDAVIARARRFSGSARQVLEIVGVVPGRVEAGLVEGVLGPQTTDAIDECLASGMLEIDGNALRFRHEIARSSIEEELSPMRRRELHGRVLAALSATPGVDPARLVHHARSAGDRHAILAAAPEAARLAAAGGAHIQAAEHYRAALEAAEGLDDAGRAGLLEALSFEVYLSGTPAEALATRREALAIRTRLGQPAEAGENERWLSRLLWWSGRREESEAAVARAIGLLEPLGPSSGLAMAYSTLSQLLMLAWRAPEAIEWGERAIALARRLDDSDTLAHALTNVGTARLQAGDEAGAGVLEEAIAIALAGGHHDHAGRALVNLSWERLRHRRYEEARGLIERGLAFARANDLSFYDQYLLGMRAWARLEQGDWTGAEDDGRRVLATDGLHQSISAFPGMVALALLLVRRGEPEGRELLAEAWRRARVADEAQRLVPAACARAEAAWLDGDREALRQAADDAVAALGSNADAHMWGESLLWVWRAGGAEVDPERIAEPFRTQILEGPRVAAAAWEALGCPYLAADALWESDDVDDDLRALAVFDRLGADAPAARLRARLRDRGAAVPAGPRRATAADPDGLTPRQREVMELLADGATNAAIAARLVVSTRTVDHHVSAILRKLGVATRADAAARARRVGEGGSEDGQVPGAG